MGLLLFVLGSYGMTRILTNGRIFDKIRPNHHFYHCSQCVGFWVGGLLFVLFHFAGAPLFDSFLFGIFLFSLISSGTSYLLSSIVDDFGVKVERKNAGSD